MRKIVTKTVAIIFVIALILSVVLYAVQAAPAVDETDISDDFAVMLLDQETGRVLYKQNEDKPIAPASTTKVLTAVVAMENCKLEDEVKVGDEVNVIGTKMGLKPGDKVTVETLLYGVFLASGNDAAAALAVHVSGSLEDFAKLMNDKAKELGMKDSHFVTVSGVDNEEHLVTASDMARLTRHAFQYDIFFEIAQTKTTTRKSVDGKTEYDLENTNRLIYTGKNGGNGKDYTYKYATGLKTGSTPHAGKCLIATAEKDGRRLIALVFGDKSEEDVKRWSIAKMLFDHGFDNFENVDIHSLIPAEELRLSVEGAAITEELDGMVQCVPVTESGKEVITLDKDLANDQIGFQIVPKEGLKAPVKAGEIVGTIEYTLGEQVIYSSDVEAAADVMSREEYEKLIVKELDPVDLEEEGNAIPAEVLWVWLIVPVGLIIFLIVRAVLIKNKRKRRFPGPRHRAGSRSYRTRRRRF